MFFGYDIGKIANGVELALAVVCIAAAVYVLRSVGAFLKPMLTAIRWLVGFPNNPHAPPSSFGIGLEYGLRVMILSTIVATGLWFAF
jgi:hypothetical protein